MSYKVGDIVAIDWSEAHYNNTFDEDDTTIGKVVEIVETTMGKMFSVEFDKDRKSKIDLVFFEEQLNLIEEG